MKKQLEKERKAHEIEKRNLIARLREKNREYVREKLGKGREMFEREMGHILREYRETAQELYKKDSQMSRLIRKIEDEESLINKLSIYLKKRMIRPSIMGRGHYSPGSHSPKEPSSPTSYMRKLQMGDIKENKENNKEKEVKEGDQPIFKELDEDQGEEALFHNIMQFHGRYISLSVNEKMEIMATQIIQKYKNKNNLLKNELKSASYKIKGLSDECNKLQREELIAHKSMENMIKEKSTVSTRIDDEKKVYENKLQDVKTELSSQNLLIQQEYIYLCIYIYIYI